MYAFSENYMSFKDEANSRLNDTFHWKHPDQEIWRPDPSSDNLTMGTTEFSPVK